jgi:putative NADH-flavin reductase
LPAVDRSRRTRVHDEIRAGAALIIEDLPATPATLDWVFVSPALRFGARMPGERLGRYRLGDDVAVQPEDGGAISAADYALGFVDLRPADQLPPAAPPVLPKEPQPGSS